MAPHQPSKTQATAPNDSEEENVRLSSFDPVAEDVLRTARNVLSSNEKRRALKRKSVAEKHEKEITDAAAQISSLFEANKHRVAKLQMTQWDRLDALNKRRSHLESLILSSMRSIELHTLNISTELSAMFKGRIEEIRENSAFQKS